MKKVSKNVKPVENTTVSERVLAAMALAGRNPF